MQITNQITSCEVCGNVKLTPVLDLGMHPMCDDLIEIGSDRICREYSIEILYCENCLTAHQRFQVPKHDLFPETYHYRSRFTADVLQGMQDLVKSCERKFGSLAGKKILDIGCNDGSLLNFFHQKGAVTIGIEPTSACDEVNQEMHTTYKDYLSKELAGKIVAANGHPDMITFTNVFAHIEDLPSVIGSLKTLLSPNTLIVIENHYLGSVLDHNQFDTFYHEHPRTYSYNSFVHIAGSLGLEPIDVEFPSRYGGNIRIFLGNKVVYPISSGTNFKELLAKENLFLERFIKLGKNVLSWKNKKKAFLSEMVKQFGPLKAKAFPGRAAILVKLLGLDTESISEVYEKPGSLKIGYYVPGTRIPIKSDEEMFQLEDKTKPIINLAWHIPTEIHSYLVQHNYTGPIIDIISPMDF